MGSHLIGNLLLLLILIVLVIGLFRPGRRL